MAARVCRSCNALIEWVISAKGKHIPVEAKTRHGDYVEHKAPFDRRVHLVHWETCPGADQHRRRNTHPEPNPMEGWVLEHLDEIQEEARLMARATGGAGRSFVAAALLVGLRAAREAGVTPEEWRHLVRALEPITAPRPTTLQEGYPWGDT